MVTAGLRWLAWERGPSLLAALVAMLAITLAIALRQQPAAAGTVDVTALLQDFNPPVVKVGNPTTSQASVESISGYNPPVPPEDEGTLTNQYDWTATVEFSSTGQSGTYAVIPQGSGTYSISIADPGNPSTKVTVTPFEAGYWEVTAACQVEISQLFAGAVAPPGTQATTSVVPYWSGTGTTKPQKFTSATVTFSPNPITTGADKNHPGAIYTAVTATVAPATAVNDVDVNTYVQLPGGTGAAETLNATRNAATGIIKFDVAGKAGTAPSMPNGDLKLEATGYPGSAVLGTDMVIVEIPKAIGNSVYTKYGGNGLTSTVTATNMDLNVDSSPPAPGISAADVGTFTAILSSVTVPVVNQFGKSLGAEYNGHEVYETISGVNGGNPVGINQKVENSSYDDPVGFLSFTPNAKEWPVGSTGAAAWLTTTQQNTFTVPDSTAQNIAVEICGFSLAPTFASSGSVAIPGNRVVSLAAGTGNQGKLTIQWNAP
jgi:hypothetical protein